MNFVSYAREMKKKFINRQLIRKGDNHIGLNDKQSGKMSCHIYSHYRLYS